MKGKSKDEAKAELEKSGMSGAELDKILPHKVEILHLGISFIIVISVIVITLSSYRHHRPRWFCLVMCTGFCLAHCF